MWTAEAFAALEVHFLGANMLECEQSVSQNEIFIGVLVILKKDK